MQCGEASQEVVENVPVAHSGSIEQDVGRLKWPRQRQAFERAAARQRNVGLTVRERAAPEIDVDLVERQPLALVDGQRPGQAQRELPERAGDRLDDLLRRLVVGVAPALPGDRLDLVLLAVDLDPDALLLEPRRRGRWCR